MKESKEKEEREEKRREREREDKRDQINQVFQLKLMEAVAGNPKVVQKESTSPQAQKCLELNLRMKDDGEADSDSFPVKIFCESFVELVTALRQFCGISPDKVIKVILFRMNQIVDMVLLENGRTYEIEVKVRDAFVRIYMD